MFDSTGTAFSGVMKGAAEFPVHRSVSSGMKDPPSRFHREFIKSLFSFYEEDQAQITRLTDLKVGDFGLDW
ncbi:hypothetical protein MLD38_019015 [Melastoma candidum]|uniref:Uncharacterized protein n=1 Tax=Melastoma candidum TaxID=119954 RepID=A0ACB9QVU0_9MYRT|nr:hypothetical protein MLD38_019015 [Melastoma candidum]